MLQDGDRFLPESNAVCFYLANGIAADPGRTVSTSADMLRWMFWEQYNHEPNIATLRFWLRFVGAGRAERGAAHADRRPSARPGDAALELMDQHLASRDWFVADRFSLADICLFAYTHVADEADFDLRALSGA